MKTCNRCQINQSLTEFSSNHAWCKSCKREYNRARRITHGEEINRQRREKRAANPQHFQEMNRRWRRNNLNSVKNSYLKKNFGITLNDYNQFLEEQDGVCAICGGPPSGKGAPDWFSVDHDHKTGKVRGLLCGLCNAGLGCLRDNPLLLQRGIEYLVGAKIVNGEHNKAKEMQEL